MLNHALKFSYADFNFSKVNNVSVYSGMKVADPQQVDLQKDSVEDLSVKGVSNRVYFKDPKNNHTITLNLTDENITKLKDNFSEDDMQKQKDGSYILNGKAGEFVSSWYGDIAYKRGYIDADSNHDNQLDKSEQKDTNTLFWFMGGFSKGGNQIFNIHIDELESYVKLGTKSKQAIKSYYDNYASSSIQSELNKTLQNDKNLDENITLNEAMSYQDRVDNTKDRIKNLLKTNHSNHTSLLFKYAGFDPLEYIAKQREKLVEELEQKLEALQKLQENGGDVSVLNVDEKTVLKGVNVSNMQNIDKAIDGRTTALATVLNTDKADVKSHLASNTLDDFTSKTIDTINSLTENFTLSGIDIRA